MSEKARIVALQLKVHSPARDLAILVFNFIIFFDILEITKIIIN